MYLGLIFSLIHGILQEIKQKHMYKKIIASAVLVAVLHGGFSIPVDAATKKVTYQPRRLDGVSDVAAVANRWPVAAMIDNHTSARPQAGLQEASVVYEALAEGGIPRFMAVYAHYEPKLIGPIRSVRPYFVRYAAEYPAAMIHAGGSPDGQELLKKLRLYNLEGIKGPTAKYFFRQGLGTSSLFTRGSSVKTLMAKASYFKRKPTYRPWKYIDEAKLKNRGKGVRSARVDLGAGRNYTVEYKYDRKSNNYLRFTGGRAHADKLTRKQLTIKNVILLFVPKEKVVDRKGRIELKTVGQGNAILMKDGKAITIKWSKASDRARTIFKDKYGKEVKLNRGNTWVTIVPKGRSYKVY